MRRNSGPPDAGCHSFERISHSMIQTEAAMSGDRTQPDGNFMINGCGSHGTSSATCLGSFNLLNCQGHPRERMSQDFGESERIHVMKPNGHGGSPEGVCRIRPTQNTAAFTLVEVVISMVVVGIMMGGLVSLYTQSAIRAEWSAYSLAGQMMALRGLEQTRAAQWDPRAAAPKDELVATNFPTVVEVLDLGSTGTSATFATNVTTIRTLSTSPPLKAIQVQCIWSFPWRGGIFTNSIFTYRAPDQ